MYAVKGIFKDAEGEYTVQGVPDMELAKNMVFSNSYYTAIDDINAEVSLFKKMVSARTERMVEQALASERTSEIISYIALVLIFIVAMINLFNNHFNII